MLQTTITGFVFYANQKWFYLRSVLTTAGVINEERLNE